MKKFLATLIIGLFLLYLLDSAFQIDGLRLEMLIDNLVRYLLGFMIIGIVSWSKLKTRFKFFMYLILLFLIADIIFDYLYDSDEIDFEMPIHDLYIFFWGAISGLFFIKYLHRIKK